MIGESDESAIRPGNEGADVKTPAYAWVVLFALYMATLASPLNLFKLPPVMTIKSHISFDLRPATCDLRCAMCDLRPVFSDAPALILPYTLS